MIAVLLDTSIRAAFIIAGVALVLRLARVRSAAVRHAAWTAVTIAMLLIPFVPKVLPVMPAELPQPPELMLMLERPVETSRDDTAVAPERPQTSVTPATAASIVATDTRGSASGRMSRLSSAPVSSLLIVVWLAGVAVGLVRFLAGWRFAHRLSSTARWRGPEPDVYDSAAVQSPVVVGMFSSRIILPLVAERWPEDMRNVVLAHERAHVRRRDMLCSTLAALNRTIHWFNPLAWWLEREIAATAEQACDDEVMRTGGEPQRYAEILVQMAKLLRHRGGRVAWQAIGMASGGSLEARIDRVLDGRAFARTTRFRTLTVLAISALVIVVGIACRQQVAPLREDPEIAKQLQRQRESNEEFETLKNLSNEEVAALDAKFAANPDDLDTARKLIIFYNQFGQKIIGWNEMVARRRTVLLGLIQRHPDSNVLRWPTPQRLDPEGWAQARALWLKYLEAPKVSPKIFAAAATFFAISEKPMAEKILLRAMAEDPAGPQPRVDGSVYRSPWTSRLGELYARAIIGSDDDTLYNVVRSVSLEESRGPFAMSARKKLEETKDAQLLRATGLYLTQNAGRNFEGRIGDQKVALGFDYIALGDSYFDRAIALDPDSDTTRRLVELRDRQKEGETRHALFRSKLGDTWTQSTPAQVAALPESLQFDVLPELTNLAYMHAENVENTSKDKAQFQELLGRTKTFAEMAMTLGPRFPADPRYGHLIYNSHMALGVVALREGNRKLAVTHLRAGADAVEAANIINPDPANLRLRLTNYLLKDGERESVAEFYERVSKFPGPQQKDFSESARAIREGRMPMSFQYMMTPH